MIVRAWCVAVAVACAADRPGARPIADSTDAAARRTGFGSAQPRFTSVAVGDDFTCALTAEGTAYCWGSNEGGRLGDGLTRAGALTPVAVAGGHTWAALSAGREHACALTAGGQAFCWGYSPEGALGTREERAPMPTPVATELRFVAISAGDQRTCGVTREGAVYCWGRFSQPSSDPGGRGGPEAVRLDTPIRFRSVSAGLTHACGIAEDARLYCWGSNRGGELGVRLGTSSPTWFPPALVPLGDSINGLSVSSVGTCAVTASGAAYCWGRNASGQLGNGFWTEQFAPNATPTTVVGGHRWKSVSTAGGYTCGVTTEGDAYCWGANHPSRRLLGTAAANDHCDTLALPGLECSTRPAPVLGNLRFRQLSTGSHTCAIAMDGITYCWGPNDRGQLGNGTTRPSVAPTPVAVSPVPTDPGSHPAERTPKLAPADTLRLYPTNAPPIPGPEPTGMAGDARIMMTLHGAVAEAVIADPLGRRLGFDPASGIDHNEIPDASYDSTGLSTLRNDSIVDEDPPWKEIYLNAPRDGEYTVWVIGTRTGTYTLSIGGYDVRRRSSWFTPKDVPITPGARHEYRFQFVVADAGSRGLSGRRVQPPNR